MKEMKPKQMITISASGVVQKTLRMMKNMKQRMIVAALIALLAFVCTLEINAPQVKATANISVSLYGHYESASSSYLILGEIKNIGDISATNITVTINGYDSSNTFINSTTQDFLVDGPLTSLFGGYVAFVLLPNAKISFQSWIGDNRGGKSVDHCTSTVSFIEATNLPSGLQITVTQAHISLNSLSISGTIKNVGTSTAPQVYIYGTCYDSNGAVIGSGDTSSDVGSLDPNQAKTFGFSCTGGMASFAGIVTSYAITAQSFTGDATSGVPQYTCTSEITGPIPEFTSVIYILLLLMATSTVLIFRKKRAS